MTPPTNLQSTLSSITSTSFSSEADRISARDALFECLRRVQSPWDIAWDQNWVNPAINAAIKTLIDMGVFTSWASFCAPTEKPITPSQLASLTGADELLIRRMLRAISGQFLVLEVGKDTYARTPWAKTLASDPSFAGMYGGFYHELNSQMFRTLPAYLASTSHKNPTDVNNCNFQFWQRDPNANMFQYVGTNPNLTAHFNDAMECHSRYNLTPWVDIYPTSSLVPSDKPLVVDIGGGKGHDLQKFLARHSSSHLQPGSLVLQDLPDILKGVPESLSQVDTQKIIKVQPHDFFTPQPASCQGAKIYFMHNVLHDWPDATARQILQTLAPALNKGYSRLLIHESLVTDEKPLSRVTVSDITMMACLAAAERTEEQWRQLVDSAGLKVVKIWRPVESVESIIEVELA